MTRYPLDALAELPRMAREHLRAGGITTLDALAALTPDELTRFKGIKTRAAAIHAGARAYVEDQPIRYADLPAICRGAGVMFDLETHPATGVPWSWGWIAADGTPHTLVAADLESAVPNAASVSLDDGRAIHLAAGSDAAWRLFADLLSDSNCPIYHWTKFDQGVLRATAPRDVIAALDGRMHDLYASFKATARLPVRSYSLKVVAPYLDRYTRGESGVSLWQEYDSWWLAWEDYRAWLRSGDPTPLARACNYQQADVEGLSVVWNWLNAP
jgi:predicted RecB family nuclease